MDVLVKFNGFPHKTKSAMALTWASMLIIDVFKTVCGSVSVDLRKV